MITTETTPPLKSIIIYFSRYWHLFVLSLIIVSAFAFIYLRKAAPIYEVRSSILLKSSREQQRMGADMMDIVLSGASFNVANDLYMLRSRSLIQKVVRDLDLHTSYLLDMGIWEVNLYKESPIIVTMKPDDLDKLKKSISLNLEIVTKKGLRVSGKIEDQTVDTLYNTLPATLYTSYGELLFSERTGTASPGKPFRVEIHHPGAAARRYRTALNVSPPSRYALVLYLSIRTSNPALGVDFLNRLVEVFNQESIRDKNMEAVNTHALIQERISVIHDELSEVEEGIASFKQVEGLTKYETDLQYNNQSAERYEQQLVEAETELKIARSLYEQINDTANLRKPVPLNVGLTDPLLKATVREYNRLLLEYERLSKSMTSENPAMIRLQEKIAGLRQNMETSLNSQLTELNIKRRDAANQSKLYSGRVGRIPTQERVFRDISRQQQFKSNLYLMLLKKREEIFWMLSATANRAKVIDEAFISGMVSPRTKIIWLASLLTGVLFPAVLLYLIEVIRFKVRSREDVDRLCEVAVLAEIPEHKEMGSIAVKEDGGEETDEAFRFLRTQLMLSMHPGQKVVTCTSTISGEGKTFTAINTAISMALLGKKVLLVGMDLRIPRLREHLKLATNRGITLYLAGFEKEIENLIVPSGIHSNLDVLPSGPVPPNPAELMGRPTLESAFETLRRLYDYIIVDSAPSGPVGDTLIMNRVTDVTLYVCRVGYSRKSNLRYANELMQSGKLSNMLLVVNDVKEYQQKYGYGYGYGYKEKKKTGKIQKLSRV